MNVFGLSVESGATVFWRKSELIRVANAILILVLLAACESIGSRESSVSVEADNEMQIELDVALNPYSQSRSNIDLTAQRRFKQAQEYMRAEQWLLAREELQWLHKSYPNLSGPIANLARVSERSGELKAAEQYYQQALVVNNLNTGVYNRYALLLRKQGRFSEAEAQYLKAIKLWNSSAMSHRNLGILYELYMGRLDDALLHYQDYLNLLETSVPESSLSGKNTKRVKSWIIDLQRRINRERRK